MIAKNRADTLIASISYGPIRRNFDPGRTRPRRTNLLAARILWRYKISMSILISAKKPKGRPSVDSEAINVRMERPHIAALDDWRRTQPGLPGRPEAIRRLIEIGLATAKDRTTSAEAIS